MIIIVCALIYVYITYYFISLDISEDVDIYLQVYSETAKTEFPPDLGKLCSIVALVVLNANDYSAEAAIVNFYHMDSTLSGHTDYSEPNREAPLISFRYAYTLLAIIRNKNAQCENLSIRLITCSGKIASLIQEEYYYLWLSSFCLHNAWRSKILIQRKL